MGYFWIYLSVNRNAEPHPHPHLTLSTYGVQYGASVYKSESKPSHNSHCAATTTIPSHQYIPVFSVPYSASLAARLIQVHQYVDCWIRDSRSEVVNYWSAAFWKTGSWVGEGS